MDYLNFFIFALLLPIVVVFLAVCLLYGLVLHLAVWLAWLPQGKSILFVTSDSPIWKDYIAANILPQIEARAVVLNWSERSRWGKGISLPVLVFHYFGGRREFNPLAVVFRPYRPAKVFRFWKPFQEHKHGKKQALKKLEQDFLEMVRLP